MTFFQLPKERSDPATARFVVLPIPYEGTVCFMTGTAKGPEAVLAVSDQIEHFDEETLRDYTVDGIATLPPIQAAETPEKQYRRIYETVKSYGLFRAGKLPVILGGEHSVTPPVVQAAAEAYSELSVLQFDAHSDLRNEYHGSRYSHAAAMRRVLEHTPHLVQVGVRSFCEEEYRECPRHIERLITPSMLEQDFTYCVGRILEELTENVYVTIDIDALDPSEAPGTGTPEPGGMRYRQLTAILKQVYETKNVVGGDIVEVAPLNGNHVVTEFLAARLAAKMMAYKG